MKGPQAEQSSLRLGSTKLVHFRPRVGAVVTRKVCRFVAQGVPHINHVPLDRRLSDSVDVYETSEQPSSNIRVWSDLDMRRAVVLCEQAGDSNCSHLVFSRERGSPYGPAYSTSHELAPHGPANCILRSQDPDDSVEAMHIQTTSKQILRGENDIARRDGQPRLLPDFD